jgi:hypothetical protein
VTDPPLPDLFNRSPPPLAHLGLPSPLFQYTGSYFFVALQEKSRWQPWPDQVSSGYISKPRVSQPSAPATHTQPENCLFTHFLNLFSSPIQEPPTQPKEYCLGLPRPRGATHKTASIPGSEFTAPPSPSITQLAPDPPRHAESPTRETNR